MARGVLPLNQISRSGLALASEVIGDAANGHQATNDGRMFVLAHNTNGSSTARTLTIHIPGTVDGQTVSSRTVSLAAGATELLGPWPVTDYGNPVLFDVSNAELKLAAYHL